MSHSTLVGHSWRFLAWAQLNNRVSPAPSFELVGCGASACTSIICGMLVDSRSHGWIRRVAVAASLSQGLAADDTWLGSITQELDLVNYFGQAHCTEKLDLIKIIKLPYSFGPTAGVLCLVPHKADELEIEATNIR